MRVKYEDGEYSCSKTLHLQSDQLAISPALGPVLQPEHQSSTSDMLLQKCEEMLHQEWVDGEISKSLLRSSLLHPATVWPRQQAPQPPSTASAQAQATMNGEVIAQRSATQTSYANFRGNYEAGAPWRHSTGMFVMMWFAFCAIVEVAPLVAQPKHDIFQLAQ